MPIKFYHCLLLMAIVAIFVCCASPGFSQGESSPATGAGGHATASAKNSGGGAVTHPLSTATKATGLGKSPAPQQRIFSDRSLAVHDLKVNSAHQYPLHFASEPAVRPGYIPHFSLVGKRHVAIVFNPQQGVYGYMSPSTHSWVSYNLWQDQATMNRLLRDNGYSFPMTTMHPVHAISWRRYVVMFLAAILVIVILLRLVSKRRATT